MSDTTHKLFLLDAYALIYRAHFAFINNPRINSKGMNTGCILGFTNTILDVLSNEKPSHIAVCFDTAEPTFRHEEYEEYKAQREEQPEDIAKSFPYIRAILNAFNIEMIEKSGFEADDVIGTLAWKASDAGFDVFMMTSDKDYGQLVRDNVFLYKPSYMGKGVEIWDTQKVLDKWDIERVDQVIDMLGMQGDAVDNIPGIPGIGPKTAAKLLKEYGSVEGLLENTDKLKGKQKEKVEANKEQALLSKRLATIITDVPIEFDAEKLTVREPETEELLDIFEDLEFRNMKKRLFGEKGLYRQEAEEQSDGQMNLFGGSGEVPVAETMNTIEDTEHDYQLITEEKDWKKLITEIKKQKEVCFDTETTSLNPRDARLLGIAISFEKGKAYYVATPDDETAARVTLDFKEILEDDSILKIAQNIKYDMLVLAKYGISVCEPMFDTMLAHYLIQPETRHNMDALAESYLNYKPVSIETLIGKKGKNQGNMSEVELEKVAEYAGEDADITLQLKEKLFPQLEEFNAVKIFDEVETPLVPVLAQMEMNGVKVDKEALKQISDSLAEEIVLIEDKIYEMAGAKFNIASPKQLGEILFDKLKLDPKAKKTRTGQYKTGEDILSRLADEHEIAGLILDFRENQKLKSTYVDALPEMIHPSDGRIHTSFNQTVTATGRLSSVNPNLQNIPIRTEKGREIRRAFIGGDSDYLVLSADYSQIELRIMAAFSQDESMLNAFKQGVDIHSTTASKVFGVDLDDVTSDQRRKAKMVNFGIIYGISAFGLSQRLNIPRKEAAEIIDQYFTQFSAVKEFMDSCIEKARKEEFVETVMGRRRYLRDINSRNATNRGFAERNAINAPIQGSAADMIKMAMIHIYNWMKKEKLQSRMVLQVHDELVFDVHKDELTLFQEKVPEFMKNAIKFDVPMDVGMGSGKNWLEAH